MNPVYSIRRWKRCGKADTIGGYVNKYKLFGEKYGRSWKLYLPAAYSILLICYSSIFGCHTYVYVLLKIK